ncbi:Protein DGCR14, partial [Armadillidium nasatum]
MTKENDKAVMLVVSDVEFKKPTHPVPRKKKVLNEEAYIKKLESIIERDYFPDLENLNDKLRYLEASESNDVVKLRELYAKYSEESAIPHTNPADSPATFDTPIAKSNNQHSKTPPRSGKEEEEITKESNSLKDTSKSDKEKQYTLDEFMSTYTSEDNESFEQVMEEQDRRWKAKHPWLFESEEEHNKSYAPNLALPSIEEQKQSKILALTGKADKEKDIRPLNVENWTYKTFNSVMFVPDGAQMSQNESIEKAKQKEREVCYDNTRFKENPFNESLSQATMLEASAIQAYKKEGKVGVDGKELRETPKVNGYSYIRSPSPAPGVDCSPMMTWGQIDGTPFQLDGSQTPLIRGKHTSGPSYKIPKVSDRDELLIKLSEKVNQNHRDRKSKALSAARSSLASPACKMGADRLSSMSPAARNLLSSKLKVNRSTDRALRASYTPSPIGNKGLSTPKTVSLTPLSARRSFGMGTPTPLKRPQTP